MCEKLLIFLDLKPDCMIRTQHGVWEIAFHVVATHIYVSENAQPQSNSAAHGDTCQGI